MKVINRVGVPVSIKENGINRIIPYDKKPYIIDDSCYNAYKDFFIIVTPPISTEKKAILEKRAKFVAKILHGKGVRNELRYKPIIMGNRKHTKKRIWTWNFISPDGKRFENVNIKEWCRTNYWVQPHLYKHVEDGKLYQGWKIERFEKV